MPSSYTCTVCKREFPIEKIKYDGKKIFCIDCCNRTMKNEEQKKKKVEIAIKNLEPIKKKLFPIKLICMHCNYKFSFKPESKANLMCPYCGGNKLRRDDATAEALVNSLIEENTE